MIREYKGKSLVDGCKLAIKHRLYVNSWTLRPCYLYYISKPDLCPKNISLYIKYKSGVPVAALLREGRSINVFVRKKFRRCGIGSSLVKRAAKGSNKPLAYCCGINGSEKFWEQNSKFLED